MDGLVIATNRTRVQLPGELAADQTAEGMPLGETHEGASMGSLALYTSLSTTFASAPHLLPPELCHQLLQVRVDLRATGFP